LVFNKSDNKNTLSNNKHTNSLRGWRETGKLRVGIIGGAGYTGGELIRYLSIILKLKLLLLIVKSNAGNLISSVHSDLIGETDLKFTANIKLPFRGWGVAVCFFASVMAIQKIFIRNNIASNIKIIDLANDFV